MSTTLRDAAQAVITRWDSPLWKHLPGTAQYIEHLRKALAQQDDLQQSLIAAGHFLRDNTSAWHEVGRHAAGSTVLYHAPGWPRDAADAAPCDMGELCIGCTPRSEGGGCPGAAASLREAAQKLCDMDAADGPVHTMNQWRTAYRDLRSALAQQDEPLFGGDERRHIICLCPDCVRPTEQQVDPAATPMFWVRLRSDGGYEGPIHNDGIERVRAQSGAWTPLYVAPKPAAQPAPVAPTAHRIPADMRAAFSKIEDEVAAGSIGAAATFTRMRTAAQAFMPAAPSVAAYERLHALLDSQAGRIIEMLGAAEQRAPAAQPVAVIGDTFSLLWASGESIAAIAERHDLKVGSKLYAAPQPAALAHPTDEQIDKLVSERGTGGWQTRGDMARFARAVLALRPVAQPLTDDQWYDLASRHANADWSSSQPDGYINAVKALVADAHKIGGAA